MLDYNTLENKAHIRNIDSDTGQVSEYIDLLSKVVDQDFEIQDQGNSHIVAVNEYYIARPDLISLAIYGTDKYADVICKFNGISNPFELNQGMLLLCPSQGDLQRYFMNGKSGGASELITNNSDIIAKKNNAKLKSEQRSPAEATIEDRNYVIDKSAGLVFY